MKPLTEEQRRLVEEHYNLARKATRIHVKQYPWLQRHFDDVLQEALIGLMYAASTWRPDGASFKNHAHRAIGFFVRNVTRRTSRQGLKYRDAATFENPFDDLPDFRWDALPAETPGPDANVDAGAVVGVREEIVQRHRRIRGSYKFKERPLALAERQVDAYWRATFHDEMHVSIAKELGCSRENIRQYVENVQKTFDRYAAEVRQEAA